MREGVRWKGVDVVGVRIGVGVELGSVKALRGKDLRDEMEVVWVVRVVGVL